MKSATICDLIDARRTHARPSYVFGGNQTGHDGPYPFTVGISKVFVDRLLMDFALGPGEANG